MSRLAIVTGVSGGLGKEIAKVLKEKGFQIFGIDLKNSNESENCFYQLDLDLFVKSQEMRGELFEKVKSMCEDPVELIVNNAAFQYISTSHPIDYNILQKSFNVNVFAAYYMTTLFEDDLTQTKGSVINISSVHARLTKRGFLAYATSKAALSAMTRSLSIEFGDKFRINCIEPAAIDTQMLREGFDYDENKINKLKDFHPTKTIASPHEIAKLIYCIHNCNISFLQGSCIDVSGGISNLLHDLES